jgi:hypothetical protein
MRALLLVRLGEEESAGIPLMRKHFTHAEIRPVSARGSWPTCWLWTIGVCRARPGTPRR